MQFLRYYGFIFLFLQIGDYLSRLQGLSSSLWTRDIRNLGRWIGPSGSDTGIVNVGREILCVRHLSPDRFCR